MTVCQNKKIKIYREKFSLEIINVSLIKQLRKILGTKFQNKEWKRTKDGKVTCVKPKDPNRNEGKMKQWENLYR